jgi:hypothetical protein
LEFIYSIFAALSLIILITFMIKSKQKQYSKESIEILINYFGDKGFSKNENILDLKEKLEMGSDSINSHSRSIKKIIDEAKHKSDIIYKYKMSINKPYTDLTTFKIVANRVIDYSVKKEISIKDSIKLLFLTYQKPYFQEVFNITKTEIELLKNFYDLLEGFVQRYKKAI